MPAAIAVGASGLLSNIVNWLADSTLARMGNGTMMLSSIQSVMNFERLTGLLSLEEAD
jgi:hypothetical protein